MMCLPHVLCTKMENWIRIIRAKSEHLWKFIRKMLFKITTKNNAYFKFVNNLIKFHLFDQIIDGFEICIIYNNFYSKNLSLPNFLFIFYINLVFIIITYNITLFDLINKNRHKKVSRIFKKPLYLQLYV
jgi:hypothetical protein